MSEDLQKQIEQELNEPPLRVSQGNATDIAERRAQRAAELRQQFQQQFEDREREAGADPAKTARRLPMRAKKLSASTSEHAMPTPSPALQQQNLPVDARAIYERGLTEGVQFGVVVALSGVLAFWGGSKLYELLTTTAEIKK